MWRRHSHILSPLINAAAGKRGKMKITWTEEMDEAFIQLKQMVTEEVFLTYPDWIYEATLSESQRVMRWRLLLKEFGPNIIHIASVDNIIADTLSRLKSNNVEEDEIESTDTKVQELFANRRVRSIQADFPLEKKLLREEQQKELKKRNSKIKKLLDEKDSEYKLKELD
ncbi:hypothetical protein CTEN210_07015 [Chaetoceros tenuissimus]|uniref:Uncharacterized protein n=1 Tax=Chaetoceros tenuissimus TaxID=426638 RepID=A0AAD3H5D4_9STRA|nr:hypothetical protein CTEN210_07015 [Chaetoceros tenuissimus]